MGRHYSRNGTGIVPTTGGAGGGVYDDSPADFGTGALITYAKGTSGRFRVPAGISKIRVTCMGAGGKGGTGNKDGSTNPVGGGGAGGGGFILKVYNVSVGDEFNYEVATDNSTSTSFDTGATISIITATGGEDGGDASTTVPGTGGAGGSFTGSGTNETDYFGYNGGNGGNGGNSNTTASGGGGGGNGLCSFVFDRSLVPHGASTSGTNKDGLAGGIYCFNAQGDAIFGTITSPGFVINPATSLSPLSRDFYDNTGNGEAGVVSAAATGVGGKGGAYAGGNGRSTDDSGKGGLGAGGAGGGARTTSIYNAAIGGDASMIIEY